MIKSIAGSGRYINVMNGYSLNTYINNNGGMNVGDVRYNPSTNNLQVCDGYSWVDLSMGHSMVGLFPEAEDAITWAIRKRQEELELEDKAKANPAIADLVEQRKKIDEQIKVIDILTKDNNVGTN
jgi:hypothetical protein